MDDVIGTEEVGVVIAVDKAGAIDGAGVVFTVGAAGSSPARAGGTVDAAGAREADERAAGASERERATGTTGAEDKALEL